MKPVIYLFFFLLYVDICNWESDLWGCVGVVFNTVMIVCAFRMTGRLQAN